MRYPERLLTDDEVIVKQFRPHWRMLLIPVLWVIGGIVVVVLGYNVAPSNGTFDLITAGIVVVGLVPVAFIPVVSWWFTSYVLTSERLITRNGILSRSGIEIPLENVNDVKFTQTIFERILKSGDLLYQVSGRKRAEPVR